MTVRLPTAEKEGKIVGAVTSVVRGGGVGETAHRQPKGNFNHPEGLVGGSVCHFRDLPMPNLSTNELYVNERYPGRGTEHLRLSQHNVPCFFGGLSVTELGKSP